MGRKIIHWTREEDDMIMNLYPDLGPYKLSKMINRTRKAIVNRAYRFDIKYNRLTKRIYRCSTCSKIICYRNKSGLCASCCAKERIKKYGYNRDDLYTKEEIELVKKMYPYEKKEVILKHINRSWCSIIHKASRLKIKRGVIYTKNLFTTDKNPMNDINIRKSVSVKIKNGWENGKYKVSGAALKSVKGLTKKENHPNWLGGISFLPYDSNFDDDFKEKIRDRDNRRCMMCNKEELEEVSMKGQKLCIHHIDYDKQNTCEDNCISLCNNCHMKTNYNRDYWTNFFYANMIIRQLNQLNQTWGITHRAIK